MSSETLDLQYLPFVNRNSQPVVHTLCLQKPSACCTYALSSKPLSLLYQPSDIRSTSLLYLSSVIRNPQHVVHPLCPQKPSACYTYPDIRNPQPVVPALCPQPVVPALCHQKPPACCTCPLSSETLSVLYLSSNIRSP